MTTLGDVVVEMDVTWRRLARDISAEVARVTGTEPPLRDAPRAVSGDDRRLAELREIASQLEGGGSLLDLAARLREVTAGVDARESLALDRALAAAAAEARAAVDRSVRTALVRPAGTVVSGPPEGHPLDSLRREGTQVRILCSGLSTELERLGGSPSRQRWRAARPLVARLVERLSGVESLIRREQQSWFPALAVLGAEGPAALMRERQAEALEALRRLRQAVARDDAGSVVENGTLLLDLLDELAATEEQVLAPIAARALPRRLGRRTRARGRGGLVADRPSVAMARPLTRSLRASLLPPGGTTRDMSSSSHIETLLRSRAQMAAEGRRIVDAARARGLTLRLIGRLAVRDHCEELAFCGRDHSDLDMVGLAREVAGLVGLFEALGYRERIHVREATLLGQTQFVRDCTHGSADGAYAVHAEDHVDVFLDAFRMDHRVDLRDRLTVERYTVSASDLLLTKLQVFKAEERDLHDIVTLLKDDELAGEDAPGSVNVPYVARLCARDWGLFYDVTRNLRRCARSLRGFGLEPADEGRVQVALEHLTRSIEAAPKARAWRLRAKVGTRLRWHAVVEEQDGESA